jgi:hypothetical protein
MGFALWIDGDVAWAQGTHEYRPMGTAVVAASDLFRPRDFRAWRLTPVGLVSSYVGLFASLGDVNAYLVSRRGRSRTSGEPLLPP